MMRLGKLLAVGEVVERVPVEEPGPVRHETAEPAAALAVGDEIPVAEYVDH
jgi:hypothetical protein